MLPEARAGWSATIRLPKTDFPMKGELARREPELLKLWDGLGLYGRLQQRQKGRPRFLLHDGPPYANGHIHIGHAQNKILKDMAVKTRALMGHAAAFVPGWDCHGLPIETELLKELKMGKRGVTDIPRFRREAAAFAERFVAIQGAEFKRLGVLADWERPYKTLARGYESAILGAFRRLVAGGHVDRGLKPVLWCVSCETALADAEVEYKDKNSPSVYVALPIRSCELPELTGAELLVWTTTPWTLPANMAVAFNPILGYQLVDIDGRRLLLATGRREAVLKALGAPSARPSGPVFSGRHIAEAKLVCEAPFGGRSSPGLAADYVTDQDGTGIVHMAPGHGEDDFDTGRRHGLEILNPVDASGHFTKEAPEFAGKHIFKEGNALVVAALKARGRLLAEATISHSYPHCWRCKNPVVFRATEQWFLRLSDGLRARLSGEIDRVSWIPPESRNRIAAMVRNRPDWCLSRQRVWGTPIPVLYSAASGRPVLDDLVLASIERRALTDGVDFWFERWGQTLTRSDWPFLPEHPQLQGGFRRESDILDVWLDSGVSWLAVLGEDVVADLYLEGSDQHRGWFQSSLVISTALRGRAPYKAVLTHGFVLDEHGRAMHKSVGNVVAPQELVAKWGADVLRLWVALADVHEDTRISDKLLAGPADGYRRVRNTLRYLLGSLCDFDAKQAVLFERLPEMERFCLHRLASLQEEVLDHYREHRYRAAARRLVDYCAFELSADYLDVVKDRLYTLRPDAPERLAAQSVMAEILRRLCALLSPILSFTAEEAWQHRPRREAPSVFLWDLPGPDPRWLDAALAQRWKGVLALRGAVQKKLEEARGAKLIGSSLQAQVRLGADPAPYAGVDLAELFIVSKVSWSGAEGVSVSPAPGSKCPRCWRWQEDIGSVPAYRELCGRCGRQL